MITIMDVQWQEMEHFVATSCRILYSYMGNTYSHRQAISYRSMVDPDCRIKITMPSGIVFQIYPCVREVKILAYPPERKKIVRNLPDWF